MHTINNVRICARKKRLELHSANIEIDHKRVNPNFITSYREAADN